MEFENTEHITKIVQEPESTSSTPVATPVSAPVATPVATSTATATPIIAAKRTRAKASPKDQRHNNTGRPYATGEVKRMLVLTEKQAQLIDLVISRRAKGEDTKGLFFALLRYALKGTILERFETGITKEELKNLLS